MKRIMFSLILVLGSLICIASPVNATECPTSWPLNFKSEYLKSGPLETTGLLESYRKSLGNNIAIEFKREFSKDKNKWSPFAWPMKWPDGEIWKVGTGYATHYLYPGFIRDVVQIDVKGCPSSAIFYSNEVDVTPSVSKNHAFEEVFIPGNFKEQEIKLSGALKMLEKAIADYPKSGKIDNRYPADDSIFFITPKTPNCLNAPVGIFSPWTSKGKVCDIYVYANSLKNTKFFDLEGNPINSTSDGKIKLGLFVLQEITLTPVSSKQNIECTKGKTTKKVSGTNPKCSKGYKVKA